jgi:hypothetical protein
VVVTIRVGVAWRAGFHRLCRGARIRSRQGTGKHFRWPSGVIALAAAAVVCLRQEVRLVRRFLIGHVDQGHIQRRQAGGELGEMERDAQQQHAVQQ